MKAVTDCSGSKGTDPTETVIQVSPATGYKQSQKTPSGHTAHDVSPAASSLFHLPPTFVVPTFGHLIITMWPSFWYHLSTMATSHPASRRSAISEQAEKSWPYFLVFARLFLQVHKRLETAMVSQYLYPPLKKSENYSLHWKATPWERASHHVRQSKCFSPRRLLYNLIAKISLHLKAIIATFCNH